MSYDIKKFEEPNSQKTETQRAETTANKFFDMADKMNPHMESERQKREMFSAVGIETAQGNYDKAQRKLEVGARWDDNLRGAASEVNQLNQERTGAKPMSFDEAQKAMSGYARDFEKISKESRGKQRDIESAMEIDNIVNDTSEPGVEGINKALEYIESTLKSKGSTADSILKPAASSNETKAEFLKDWQEKRTIRDALYQEKQKRAEQSKQSQQVTEALTRERGATTRNLENLYDNAGIPEDTPSRQEFFARVQRMPEEELRFLCSALKKTAVEFGRNRDPKILDRQLMDLVSKSFKREDVAKRQNTKDQGKIEQIRVELGLEGANRTPAEEAPKQERGQNESKAENLFQTLADSPEIYLDRLKDENRPNIYSPVKSIRAVVEVFQELYPDKKQLTSRIEELFGQYVYIRDESRKEEPDKDESSHEHFAINETAQRLSAKERKAIEKIIKDKIDVSRSTPLGVAKSTFTKEHVLGNFIRFLEDIKEEERK